jgi:hypothetical protein
MNSFRKPYRPPAMIQPAWALEGLRRKCFAVGYELTLKPAQLKERATILFEVPIFDKLSADQLNHLIGILEKELAEQKRTARRNSESAEKAAAAAAAADDPIMNHPLVSFVRARFPTAQVVTNVSTQRDA